MQPGSKAPLVSRGLPALKVSPGNRVPPDTKVYKGQLASKVPRDTKGRPGNKASQASRGQRVSKAP